MGWTDREPYFSMIESRTDQIVEKENIPRDQAWGRAYEDVSEGRMEAAMNNLEE